ncbi:MAG: ABC transporter permease, partial [Actinomycetota bacterium]|nr:ABC transporter permease [Actinomycetota bacterium]
GAAAGPAVQRVGPYARYSLGAGVWLAGFAAFALIISARRELGLGTVPGWVVTLLAPVGIAIAAAMGSLDDLGILVEYHNLGQRFWPSVVQHITYSASSIIVATILGVGLGVVAYRFRRASAPIFSVVSAFQTVPGLALIGILVAPMAALSYAFPALRRIGVGGLGWAPVVLALTLYALLAIVRNTYAGLASVPPQTVEAGRGMGMTSSQVVRRVQMPLAAPVVFSGVRTASQQTVANATLGAFVAAGGLGPLVFFGLAQQANDLVVLGSIALVALALTVDGLMRGLQYLVTPKRIREHMR